LASTRKLADRVTTLVLDVSCARSDARIDLNKRGGRSADVFLAVRRGAFNRLPGPMGLEFEYRAGSVRFDGAVADASLAPICLFVRPSDMSRITSRSRGDPGKLRCGNSSLQIPLRMDNLLKAHN